MALFIVTYQHPNEDGWRNHVMPHAAWLQERVRDGSLIASGPFTDQTVKSALLVMSAPDISSLKIIISSDPFAVEGLIENMTIQAWDPIFGVFNDRSSMPKPK